MSTQLITTLQRKCSSTQVEWLEHFTACGKLIDRRITKASGAQINDEHQEVKHAPCRPKGRVGDPRFINHRYRKQAQGSL